MFDKVVDTTLVINLKKDKERRQNIENNLQKNRIKYELIEGVYGKELTKGEKEQNFSSTCVNFCSFGAMGCALSHRKCWQKIVNERKNICMILEDDAEINEDFRNEFEKVYSNTPSDWDIIYFSYIVGNGRRTEYNFFENFMTLTNNIEGGGRKINNYVYVPDLVLGTGAYLVNYKACVKLLKLFEKIEFPGHIDHLLAINPEVKKYCAYRKIIESSLKYGSNTSKQTSFAGEILSPIILKDDITLSEKLNTNSFRIGETEFNYFTPFYFLLGALNAILFRKSNSHIYMFFILQIIAAFYYKNFSVVYILLNTLIFSIPTILMRRII